MTKLYDLYLIDGGFQMRAPIAVILQTLHLDNERAFQRAELETQLAPYVCTFHKNGRAWVVQRALQPLGVEVEEKLS